MKPCSCCKVVKSAENYGRRGAGVQSFCKTCQALKYQAWAEKNKEKKAVYAKAYALANQAALKIARAVYVTANAVKIRETTAALRAKDPLGYSDTQRAYYAANREQLLTSVAQKRREQPDLYKARAVQQRAKHGSRMRVAKAAWDATHKEHIKAYTKATQAQQNQRTATYRAKKRQASPVWANTDKIQEFYDTAAGLSMLLGEFYHVDHIVPIKGRTVCGLHCEANLQILTARENISKGNRIWPDQPPKAA